jgi:ribosomal protein S18 acetylase RimI-like enzyme
MTSMTVTPGEASDGRQLRPAECCDLRELALMWCEAWSDGHRGHVPDALMAVRGPEHFERYLQANLANTIVAIDQRARLVGLVIVDPSSGEVVQLGVQADARGSGIATELVSAAETRLAHDHDEAWLAVVPGNTRARAFYRRHGWQDEGPMVYYAPAGDTTVPVPVHRYVKQLFIQHGAALGC